MASLPYAEDLFHFLSTRETSTKNYEYVRRFVHMAHEQHLWRSVTCSPVTLL